MRPARRQCMMTWLALMALTCHLVASLLHGPHSHSHGQPAVDKAVTALITDPTAPSDPADNDRDCELCAMLAAAGLFVLTLTAALLLAVLFEPVIARCVAILVRLQDGDRRPRARAPPSPAVA